MFLGAADVDMLQIARSPEEFGKAANALIQQWQARSPSLASYFKNEWVLKHRNWFEGLAHMTPSTNNALESFNNVIKNEQTLRQRIDLGQFRMVLFNMMRQWTEEYTNKLNEIKFGHPEITLRTWTNGYNFARPKSQVTSYISANKCHFTTQLPLADELNRWSGHDEWRTFRDFKRYICSAVTTSFDHPTTALNWLNGVCNCRTFYKEYLCEHVVGFALRLKLTNAPNEAKAIPIGQKRKRGRPAKAKSALCLQ